MIGIYLDHGFGAYPSIWRTEDKKEECIGSVEELKREVEKSVSAGLMKNNH